MLRLACVAFVFLIFFQINMVYAKDLHTPYDSLLKTYVKNGLVDYKGLKNEYKILSVYLHDMSKISKETFDSWSQPDQLAYLVNLYNSVTLQLIINNYPVKSIKDIGSIFQGPWKKKIVRLFGKAIDLDTLEHKIIRRDYHEPRIHLALVCAAKSCPPLRSEAYTGEKLHDQFEEQGKIYFNSPHGLQVNRIENKVYLTRILKWYEKDFLSITDFAQKYTNKSLEGLEVDWLKYDWSLNE